MNAFRKIFSRHHTEIDEAAAALKEGLANSLKPRGIAKSAASGARIRDRVLAIIAKVESDTGEPAVILAADGVLTNPKLHDKMQQQLHSAVLEPYVPMCFPMSEAPLYLNPVWSSQIMKFQGSKNTESILFDKASFLATFVIYNLGVGIEVYTQLKKYPPNLTNDEQLIVRLEEAACWYRVIDELTYISIREHRPLFVDLFIDFLVEMLALQGISPDLICRTMEERSHEYSQYREWATSDVNKMAGTLLWRAGKHVGEAFRISNDFLFIIGFGDIFLRRVKEAMVYELLTGSS